MTRERRADRQQRLSPFADPARNLATAQFFHGHLNAEQARGFSAQEEALRAYLGACINFASGAVEALSEKLGVEDAGADETWRSQQSADDLALFDRMRDIRIEAFHYGVLPVTAGRKWVNALMVRGVTVFSVPGVFVEATNPDGEVVRGPALASVPTLFTVEHAGQQLEATVACQRFIALVGGLIAARE